MIKSIKTIVAIVLVMVLALTPTAALAAGDTEGLTGSVTVSNYTPVIGAVTMDALTENGTITLTVPVTDYNTLNDITEVWVVLALDSGDQDSDLSGKLVGDTDVDTLAIMKWTSTASDFALVGPAGTNWSVANKAGASVEPTLTDSTGNFVFEFSVSEVARYAVGGGTFDGWDVYIKVTDNATATDTDTSLADKAMAAYASITIDDATIGFGSLAVGASQQPLTDPADGNFTVTSAVNRGYALKIHSTNWTSTSGTLTLDNDGSPAKDNFSMEVDDDADVLGSQFMDTTATTIAGHDADGPSTTEAGDGVDIALWVTLSQSITYAEEYSGAITVTVEY